MNKLAFASLGFVALVSAAATTLAGTRGVDLGLDPAHLDFTYQSPSGDLAELPMTPNTVHNPLLLPCDVTLFGAVGTDLPGRQLPGIRGSIRNMELTLENTQGRVSLKMIQEYSR